LSPPSWCSLFPRRHPHMLLPLYPWPPLPRCSWTIVSHTCLGFLLLSIPIRGPKYLSSLLSTILDSGSWFSIPLIWLFLILSLPVFPCSFLSASSLRLLSYFLILLTQSNCLSHRVVIGR
jgi:hypothetical protein